MDKKKQLIYGAAIGLGLILILGIFKFAQIMIAITMNGGKGPPPQAVTTYQTSFQEWEEEIVAVGELKSVDGAVITPQESGTVTKTYFQTGDSITKDTVLAELDVAAEKADLAAAEARLKLAEQSLTRTQTLIGKNATFKSDLEKTEAEKLSAVANVNASRAKIHKKSILAPFDGKVGIIAISIGEYVQAGTKGISIFSSNILNLNFDIAQKFSNKIIPGQKVIFSVDTFPNKEFQSQVSAIDPNIDPETRTMRVQATYNNEDNQLKSGMFAHLKVLLGNKQNYITIPQSAIKYAPYGNSVFALDRSDKNSELPTAKQIMVQLGGKRGDQIAVLSGLTENLEIASSGVFKLFPGAAIIVNNNSILPSNSANPKPENA